MAQLKSQYELKLRNFTISSQCIEDNTITMKHEDVLLCNSLLIRKMVKMPFFNGILNGFLISLKHLPICFGKKFTRARAPAMMSKKRI